ncbi:hypothetical protein [Conexibacter sp. SYSU D00693]|uniref:hypothetical protein n=1 Tax=Conexibacter sp. SYSU D00693 TaxID=2812560 RepID=UPI00196B91AA|nr:hypothetical protein [Conexibacter sp. SYSU D00693]
MHQTAIATPVDDLPRAVPPSQVRERVLQALALGGRPVHRLGTAQTSVAFLVRGGDQPLLTLLLDRQPPVLAPDDAPAEVTLVLEPGDVDLFARGRLQMANALLGGRVVSSGPVRRYLQRDPILRALLRRVDEGVMPDAAAPGTARPRR